METRILSQPKNGTPVLGTLKAPVADLSHNETLTFCVVESGMASGEPSVVILSENDFGTVVLQTSLDKLITSVVALIGFAERDWGWRRPEGYFSLAPLNEEMRKTMLESIKKELEEWDE